MPGEKLHCKNVNNFFMPFKNRKKRDQSIIVLAVKTYIKCLKIHVLQQRRSPTPPPRFSVYEQ